MATEFVLTKREKLHNILVGILGSRHVYFNPPKTVRMTYPAIVYSLSSDDNSHADNIKYLNHLQYKITLITDDPDTELRVRLLELPFCKMTTPYTSDGLYHFVFNIFY